MFLIFMLLISVWFSSGEHSLLIPHLQNTKLTHFVTLLGKVSPLHPGGSHCSTEGKNTRTTKLSPEAAAIQNPQTTAPENYEIPRRRRGDYSGSELVLLAEPCPSLLLTPNQNCVIAWASTHSSNSLPPSCSLC